MSEEKVKFTEALITEEMLTEVRKFIGTKFRIGHSINNAEATGIAIQKFADGIGDTNPLWTDAEYAAKTRYGADRRPAFMGLQRLFRHSVWLQRGRRIPQWKHHRVLCAHSKNDTITPEMICTAIEGPKKSVFAENTIIERNDNLYTNQRGELATKVTWEVIHFERAKAKKTGKYHHIQLPHPWTEEELKKIEDQVFNEERSGANTPCWDDVEVGQELKPLVKGPITMTDEIAFLIGGGAPIPRLTAGAAALQVLSSSSGMGVPGPRKPWFGADLCRPLQQGSRQGPGAALSVRCRFSAERLADPLLRTLREMTAGSRRASANSASLSTSPMSCGSRAR